MNNAFVNLLLRWLILALGVVLSTKLVPGISCDSGTTLLGVVILLSVFNVILKPVLMLFALPFILLTLGLGIWLINAFLFYMTGKLVSGFHVASFGSALLGALIVSVTSMVINRLMTPPKPPAPPSSPSGGGERGKGDVIDI